MEQRRFRPGDVLDDYCPRERRITNHAVVAMIEDRIQQTRCVVCAAEHAYKEGRVPAPRRRKPESALYTQVLDGLKGPQPAVRRAQAVEPAAPEPLLPPPPPAPAVSAPTLSFSEPVSRPPAVHLSSPVEDTANPTLDEPAAPLGDEGPVRRPLIRATLPRIEGQAPPAPARVLPEFTVRQPHHSRGGGGAQQPRRRRHGGGAQAHAGGGSRFGRGGGGQRGHGNHFPSNDGNRAGGGRRGGKKR